MSSALEGRTAVITGGTRGVGYAIAHAFVSAGARVLVVSRKPEAVRDAAAKLGKNAHGVAMDVNSPDAAARLTAEAHKLLGPVDILVNCAGVFIYKPLLELSSNDWATSLATNLTAPFELIQAFGRSFVTQKSGGCIINITSVHGAIADANGAAQSASKFGLEGLTKAAAEAMRPYDVRVNAIAPGAIEPDSATEPGVGPRTRVTQADVASLAVYLASDAARTITGSTIELFGVTRPALMLG